MSDLRSPTDAIRAHLAEWDVPYVELDCFGSADPSVIAEMVDRFCRSHLASPVRGYLFCTASQGSTHGVELVSGERVVLKTHPQLGSYACRPDSATAMRSVQRAMQHLRAKGFGCPEPVLGPTPLGRGLATVERHLDAGARGNGFDADCRMTMAEGLHEVIRELTPLRQDLPGLRRFFPSAPHLYPPPHSKLFDFPATEKGAGWIDQVARRARERAGAPSGLVIGHGDWRVEHLRFVAHRITSSYDWDSLMPAPEIHLVAAAAATHTADWSEPRARNLPTEVEIDAFIDAYGMARGDAFDRAERRAARAFAAYVIAYCARCQHAAHPNRERDDWPDDSWIGLLHLSGEALLA